MCCNWRRVTRPRRPACRSRQEKGSYWTAQPDRVRRQSGVWQVMDRILRQSKQFRTRKQRISLRYMHRDTRGD
uniref:Uncharacterized protein n=1 Tax=Arundo donax TaxID=35708 RepID=A0A0A8YYF7_ARUDO